MRAAATILVLCSLAPFAASQQKPTSVSDPARSFFDKVEVVRVRITLAAGDRQQLREKAREYARAALRIDGVDFANVGIKLKGAAGSFREIDDRPGFTVHLGKFGGELRLHGLQRFHLNNCVQDDTLLCEWLGHAVFESAQSPAPRVSHAHVWLDGVDLGLYVLREAFDKQFLQRVFASTSGNLYDGGFCQDVDQALEKDSGSGPDDHSDLRALADLCQGVDATREKLLAAAVDVPAFVDFIAIEAMLGHWDGYSRNMNNFRLWLPVGGRAVFLPHGMDQLLGDADASVLDHPPAIVASAVLQQPAFRKLYRDRLKVLLPLFSPNRLLPRLKVVAARLQKELGTIDDAGMRRHEEAVRGLAERIQQRHASLERQVKAPEPKPLQLTIGKALALRTWNPAAETDHIELHKKSFGGVPSLHVHCRDRGDEQRLGVFRTHLLLSKGRYQLRCTARCERVVRPPDDADGNSHGGVRLRVGDLTSERLDGNQNWRELTCDFEVGEFQRSVELACEAAVLVGSAWFRLDSLQLVRLPD